MGQLHGSSGQKINFQKSSILFSPNVESNVRNSITECLRVKEVGDHGNYLGVPSLIGRSKKVIFDYISERAHKRITSWKRKHLSISGKEVLLKSIAQAIPLYAMQVFQLPCHVIACIEKMFSDFWWGKAIHWMRWGRLCQSKDRGGLNFRLLKEFNIALLAKQGWNFIAKPNSLLCRVFKQRYFPHCDFLNASIPQNASFVWRSIMAAQNILKEGTRTRIGNGRKTRIWGDSWLPSDISPVISSPPPVGFEEATINLLIDEDRGSWNLRQLELLFSAEEQRLIKSIQLLWEEQIDSFYWRFETSGFFSVKSCYYALLQRYNHSSLPSNFVDDCWAVIWDLKIPPRISIFLWKAATKCLPTLSNLQYKHVQVDPLCSICGDGIEDEYHALVVCPYALAVWTEIFGCGWPSFITSITAWWSWISSQGKEKLEQVACILWAIWARRNNWIWNGVFRHASQVIRHGLGFMGEWRNANRESIKPNHPISEPQWRPPPQNC